LKKLFFYFTKIIEINSNDDSAWHLRGSCRYQLADWKQALYDFSQAKTLAPSIPNNYLFLGSCYLKIGKIELAKEHLVVAKNAGFEEAIKLLKSIDENK
jgi:tetratricopeptide (TPR) repeat protein